MKDIAIIDAFPVYNCQKKVLNVGCGEGRIDYHLASIGYKVYATDIKVKNKIELKSECHNASVVFKEWTKDPSDDGVYFEPTHWCTKCNRPCNIKYTENPLFYLSDIFDLSSFPIKSSPIVICSQVLEHLSGYKTALVHLLALTEVRLIITVPYRHSFSSPDHINFWDDGSFVWKASDQTLFRGIDEFIDLCAPYSTSISKIRTKPEDVKMGQWNYLIVVDKRQNK